MKTPNGVDSGEITANRLCPGQRTADVLRDPWLGRRFLYCSADLAADIVGLLQHLGLERVDVFGFSVGGATALHLAVNNPNLVRKLIVSSVSFHPAGDREENSEAVGSMTVDMIAGTPMEQEYLAKSPHPGKLQDLLDKLGTYDKGFRAGPMQTLRESPSRPSSPSETATRSSSITL